MATYLRDGWVLMTAFPATGQASLPSPMDPQPEEFDDRLPPNGHRGLPVMSPDGKTIQEWIPPADVVAPVPVFRLLTPNQVEDLFIDALGLAGYLALRAKQATVPEVEMFSRRLDRARDISRSQAESGIALMVAALAGEGSPLTAEQAAAILVAWPMV